MTKVNFENGFPVNWTMKDMDVVEMDKDVGHVLIPSILNGVPQLGQFSTHFDIADKGTFQLDLKLKIQHFNSSLSLEDNPYLQILLLRNISLETSTTVQASTIVQEASQCIKFGEVNVTIINNKHASPPSQTYQAQDSKPQNCHITVDGRDFPSSP